MSTWEIEVWWSGEAGEDPRAAELGEAIGDGLGIDPPAVRCGDIYFLSLMRESDAERFRDLAGEAARELFADPVTQRFSMRLVAPGERPRRGVESATLQAFVSGESSEDASGGARPGPIHVATVLGRPGVMDPREGSIRQGVADLLGLEIESGDDGEDAREGILARTGLRVVIGTELDDDAKRIVADRVLANPAIQTVVWDDEDLPPPFPPAVPYSFAPRSISLRGLSDRGLERVSQDGQLSLSVIEMRAIRDHFARLGRDPFDVELETIAQTWSEHCCHKTLTSPIEHEGPDGEIVRFENLLRDTIARATETLILRSHRDFCLSVFRDNAGVIAFDDAWGLTFKVETHNHPSAIEPYGGAGTGIGGVLRDTLGTGLGAKPIVNTDVFCLGPPDLPKDAIPPGALHPLRVLHGVVAGVRDYGNRMGIPTASGGLFFDERYTTNPLVFAGSVGIIPRGAIEKEVRPGDRVIVVGGRTGRDGIHGATFSSIELTEESETVSSGAVQIGNPITEKRMLDVLLEARDRGLYRAVTDCGAGGLSSAVGEMGEETGARVELARVPLKYEGLSYWEIWISEAQERMVLAVPPENVAALAALARAEDVECTDIGEFTGTGRLELLYDGQQVCDLEMAFLHKGRPRWSRTSRFVRPAEREADLSSAPEPGRILRAILASPNVASKEWVIRQYDHEVQARSVLRPIQGPLEGPGDAPVFAPVFGSLRAFAIGCGMNPRYGDLDPYRMAVSAVDEAMRNVVATGADPDRTAILDNFCWGRTDRPETLGSLVEAARGCHDAAIALGAPFISGKDSLNNEFRVGDRMLSIPPSLLISSIGIVEDARFAVSMDLKAPGHAIVLVGDTRRELGGSHLLAVLGERVAERGTVPGLPAEAPRIHRAVHRAIVAGLVRAAHDLSEGGLLVALAEMAFAGGIGAEVRLADVSSSEESISELELLFAESNARYVLEVAPESVERLLEIFADLPAAVIGETLEYGIVRVLGKEGDTVVAEPIGELREIWSRSLTDAIRRVRHD